MAARRQLDDWRPLCGDDCDKNHPDVYEGGNGPLTRAPGVILASNPAIQQRISCAYNRDGASNNKQCHVRGGDGVCFPELRPVLVRGRPQMELRVPAREAARGAAAAGRGAAKRPCILLRLQ